MLGCASSVQRTEADEAGVATDSTPAVDASRCDPSVLDDSVIDVGTDPVAVHVVELAVSSTSHQCARMSDGTVRCRGRNDVGQLGLGTAITRSAEATPVPGLTDVAQIITTARQTTCTRHLDGTVRCWGAMDYGLSAIGRDSPDVCPGSRPGACRARPTLLPGLTEVTQLAAGQTSVCAVRRDGSVWCWGSFDEPLPGGGTTMPVRVERLSEVTGLWYRTHTWIVRHRDGRYTRVDTFPPFRPEPWIPRGAEIDERIPSDFFCYRLPDTSIRCAGDNTAGQLGNGTTARQDDSAEHVDPGLCGVRSTATGNRHTCALLADRTVSCWGHSSNDSLGITGQDPCGAFGMLFDCVARPTRVPGIDRVTHLFAGDNGTCALRTDHSVWCWGSLHPDRSPTPQPVVW